MFLSIRVSTNSNKSILRLFEPFWMQSDSGLVLSNVCLNIYILLGVNQILDVNTLNSYLIFFLEIVVRGPFKFEWDGS